MNWLPSLFENMEELRDFMNTLDPLSLRRGETGGLSIYEDKDRIYVEAALPGISSNEIKVSYERGMLWIKGEKKEEKKERHYHRKSSSAFSYYTSLPSAVDEKGTPSASLKDGILTISFKKSKKIQGKKIQIKVK